MRSENHGVDESAQLVSGLASRLAEVQLPHPLRVGIDGPCGSGKSTLARALVEAIAKLGRCAIHVDSDGFHNQREVRYRQGRDSARGYYEDAYNFDALTTRVLAPLGPGGSRIYATKVHDMATDNLETGLTAAAPQDAVVVFDCTFIQRGTLRDWWDEVIYLHVSRHVALERGVARDAAILGGIAGARRAYEQRYMAACDIYIREENPAERASILLEYDDPQRPTGDVWKRFC
jgi:uridine kinase